MARYLETGGHEELDRAEAAFRRALELNADLPIAHKLYAQFEVDRGRAHDAMMRLVSRARSADPELFAGLVDHLPTAGYSRHPLPLTRRRVVSANQASGRVCRIRGSLQRDHERVARNTLHENP